MRRITKYKIYFKNKFLLSRAPVKITRFKRPKWLKARRSIYKYFRRLGIRVGLHFKKIFQKSERRQKRRLYKKGNLRKERQRIKMLFLQKRLDLLKVERRLCLKPTKDFNNEKAFLIDDNLLQKELFYHRNLRSWTGTRQKIYTNLLNKVVSIKNPKNGKKYLIKVPIVNIKRPKPRFVDFTRQKVNFVVGKAGGSYKPYLDNTFRSAKRLKKYLISLYGCPINIKRKHSRLITYRSEALKYYLLKHWLKIDVLLWYLNIFTSTYEARQFINNKSVLVNDKQVNGNYYLTKGDVISIKLNINYELQHSLLKIKSKLVPNRIVFPFLEYDRFTKTFIVLKDFKEFTYQDVSWLIHNRIRITELLYKK